MYLIIQMKHDRPQVRKPLFRLMWEQCRVNCIFVTKLYPMQSVDDCIFFNIRDEGYT